MESLNKNGSPITTGLACSFKIPFAASFAVSSGPTPLPSPINTATTGFSFFSNPPTAFLKSSVLPAFPGKTT